MPKITIYEEDYTGSGNSITLNQTVLIPGKATKDGVVVGDEFELKGSASVLSESVGEDIDDLGYKIAKLLLDVGMTVLYVVISVSSETPDYSNTTRKDTWWAKFEDKSVYSIRFITTGADYDATANSLAARTAANRGDAVALMYVPRDIAKDYEKAYKYINDPNAQSIDKYVEQTVQLEDEDGNLLFYLDPETELYKPLTKTITVKDGTQSVASIAGLPSAQAKYAAGFVPNFSIVQTDGSELALPGYVAYLGCFATYVNRFASWFAFAGAQRGLIPWNVKFDADFGELAIDKLQNRSTASIRALNPICNIRNYGNLVWGNRTLWPVSTGKGSTTAGLTASSFLNIRMLVSDIKNHLYNIAKAYTFDPNSSLLWTRFYNSVVPLLEDMKTNQGIKGYKLTQVKDTKKATLRAVLRIIPIEAVEDFIFNIELADSIEIDEE